MSSSAKAPSRRFSRSASIMNSASELGLLDASHLAQAQAETKELNEDGFRVVAVAYKEMPTSHKPIPSPTRAI